MGIYIASKSRHASKWLALRNAGQPVISTWIDEAGEGETSDWCDLWGRCISEASSASGLLLYGEPGEELHGALIEAGAALAANVPVALVGPCHGFKRARYHQSVVGEFATVEQALAALGVEEGRA